MRDRFERLDGRAAMIVEKTPAHIDHTERIRRLFPDASFVVTLRSGVQVLKSHEVAYLPFMSGAFESERTCKRWRKSTVIALAEAAQSDCVTVRYPDIIKDPHRVATRIFRALDLDLSFVDDCVREMKIPRRSASPAWSADRSTDRAGG